MKVFVVHIYDNAVPQAWCEVKGDTMMPASTIDPTTASIEAANVERDRLRAEVLRLSQALVAAYTDSEAVSAERDLYRAEADRLRAIGETMFVEGYDHFRKVQQTEIVTEVEKIWMKDKLS